jgi:hypothetical protein
MLSVILLNAILQSDILLSCILLIVTVLIVILQIFIMLLSVILLNAILFSVILLNATLHNVILLKAILLSILAQRMFAYFNGFNLLFAQPWTLGYVTRLLFLLTMSCWFENFLDWQKLPKHQRIFLKYFFVIVLNTFYSLGN